MRQKSPARVATLSFVGAVARAEEDRKQAIALYFEKNSLRSTYGTAGSPLVVLLWVYYSALLFYWGAEFTKVYAKALGSQCDQFGKPKP